LRAGREAQGVPQKVLAAKLGIQRQAWAQFEGSEARGAISLYSLRRAADALGYELVYFLVPKADSSVGGAAADPSATNGTTPAGLTPPPTGIETKTAAETAPVEGARANWFEAELPTELR
jgi:transcriptional regulator with XRE-family HTH domain